MCVYVQQKADAAVFRMPAPDVLPAALAQRQSWSVGGASTVFSPPVICGPPPMRQSCAHPPATGASAAACTQAEFLHMFTKPDLGVKSWMSISGFCYVFEYNRQKQCVNDLTVIRVAFQS